MKKALLGSTALVTAGLVAAPAGASELSVRISGYMNGGFYAINADDLTTVTPAQAAQYEKRLSPTAINLFALNRDGGTAAPVFAVSCPTGTLNVTPGDDEFGLCEIDNEEDAEPTRSETAPVAGTTGQVYYVQTQAAQAADPERTEYGDSDVKLGGGRIIIDADGTLENGLTAGGRVRIEAFGSNNNSASSLIDEHYIYLSGGFGRVILGAKNGASYQMHYTSPWFAPGNGVDSPNYYNIARTSVRTTTYTNMSNDALKITYFTPRFAGVQLGASYTPDNDDRNGVGNGFGARVRGGDNGKAIDNIYDVGINYVTTWQDIDFAASAGWEGGEARGGNPDPSNWSLGTSLGWGNFTVGGAYLFADNFGLKTTASGKEGIRGREQKAWTVGVAYGTGPWRVGAAYFDATGEGGRDSESNAFGKASNSFLELGGSYAIGRGVDVGVELQFIEDDNGGIPDANGVTSTRKLKSSSGGVIMAISF